MLSPDVAGALPFDAVPGLLVSLDPLMPADPLPDDMPAEPLPEDMPAEPLPEDIPLDPPLIEEPLLIDEPPDIDPLPESDIAPGAPDAVGAADACCSERSFNARTAAEPESARAMWWPVVRVV